MKRTFVSALAVAAVLLTSCSEYRQISKQIGSMERGRNGEGEWTTVKIHSYQIKDERVVFEEGFLEEGDAIRIDEGRLDIGSKAYKYIKQVEIRDYEWHTDNPPRMGNCSTTYRTIYVLAE